MIKPLVSVIMPTYNTPEPLLKSAIESILAQTYKNFEFIIIDDGSINNDFEIIKSYEDERISAYQNVHNSGLPYTLNRAISLSKGKYIARMDSDDISLPKRLEEMVKFLEKNKDIDIAGSYYREFGSRHRLVKVERYNEIIRPTMILTCPFCHPSIVFRKSSIQKYNIKYSNEEKAEDYNLWVKCSLNKEIVFANLDKVLLKYRIHGEQLTIKNKDDFLLNAMNNRKKILDSLEVELNPKESNLYLRFCLASEIMTESDFKDIDRILQRIVTANEDKQIYEVHALRKVLANKYKKEYIRRKFLLGQNCGQAYKTFSLRKHATSLIMDYAALIAFNAKNIFVR